MNLLKVLTFWITMVILLLLLIINIIFYINIQSLKTEINQQEQKNEFLKGQNEVLEKDNVSMQEMIWTLSNEKMKEGK